MSEDKKVVRLKIPDPRDDKYWCWKDENEEIGIPDLFDVHGYWDDLKHYLSEIETIKERLKRNLKRLQTYKHKELARREADKLIMDFLTRLGFKDVVEELLKIKEASEE